jgi:hypothetical protein
VIVAHSTQLQRTAAQKHNHYMLPRGWELKGWAAEAVLTWGFCADRPAIPPEVAAKPYQHRGNAHHSTWTVQHCTGANRPVHDRQPSSKPQLLPGCVHNTCSNTWLNHICALLSGEIIRKQLILENFRGPNCFVSYIAPGTSKEARTHDLSCYWVTTDNV